MTELDRLIRAGSMGEARQLLLDLNLQKIPRLQAAGFADLGRRLNVPGFMLQVLKPIVRSEIKLNPPPTSNELALYATGLSRLGGFREAEKILNTLNADGNPAILLYQAQNQMLQWNYNRPIPYLKKYIRAKEISDYERLVGMVNLAASHVWNMKWKLGAEVLESIQQEVLKQPNLESYKLIHGYSFELMAEMALLQEDLITAEKWLIKANELLSGSRSRYEFFVKKWQAILDVLKAPENSTQLENLRRLRSEALKLKDWETQRDCEFYEALATRNDSLFLKVYFGTPYPKYRERICSIYKPNFTIPASFQWDLFVNLHNQPVKVFNMQTAGEVGGKPLLASKPLLFKLFEILSRDFYRPTPVGSLVSELYPNEYFNPVTSPQKCYKAVIRLREWLQESQIPLEITVENENYQLLATGPYSIRVFAEPAKSSPAKKSSELQILFQYRQYRPFTAAEAAAELKMSARTAQRFLEKTLADKKIVKTAQGRSTRYRFVK